jgi:hypothetical protein
MSPRVHHLLDQAERVFCLAETMTHRADTEWLKQIGQLLLDEARRAVEDGAGTGS